MPEKRPVKRHPVIQPLDKPFRYIPLTQGQTAIVDVEDFEWLNKWNWYAAYMPNIKSFYATRGENAPEKSVRTIRMHQEILSCKKEEKVDHENRNTLDNRRVNLRRCNGSQNNYNTGLTSRNTSGHKGVSFHKASGKWRAQICANYKCRLLGFFNSAEEAAQARNAAANTLHGEFARSA